MNQVLTYRTVLKVTIYIKEIFFAKRNKGFLLMLFHDKPCILWSEKLLRCGV